jgi:outer membrane autotransporter protein
MRSKSILLATTALVLPLLQVPASAQQIITSGNVTPVYPGGNPWNLGGSNLTVGNTSNGSLTIQNGGAVTNAPIVFLGASAGATGQVTMNNGSLTSQFLEVGSNGQGILTATNSTINTTQNVAAAGGVGYFAGSTGTMTLNNSIWNSVGSIGIGNNPGATGTLNVLNGSKVNVTGTAGSGFFVGNVGSTSRGTVLIDGAGSAVNSVVNAYVGAQDGTGTVTIQNGGLLHADGLIDAGAFNTTATGTITVTGAGSAMTAGTDINVGMAGHGTLNVLNQATVDAGGIFTVGNLTAGVGDVLVDGAGSKVTSARLVVGGAGTGTMVIQNGGVLTTTNAAPAAGDIADQPGGTGSVTVTGAGSAWNSAGSVGIGQQGNGTLNILNGGKVTAAAGVPASPTAIANVGSGSVGRVLVDGAGSSFTIGGDFEVANQGTGNLTVSNGGAVSATQNSFIGFSATGVGTATVTGAGSAWTTSSTLAVGVGGRGTLTIADNGQVSAAATTIAQNAGSTGTLNIGAAAGSAAAAPGTLNTPTVAFGSGSGQIVFNHTSNSYTFAPAISGTGAVDAYSGTTIMTGASTYAGPTTVHAGTLAAGAANVFSPNSSYFVQSPGTLDLRGNNQTVASLTNAGLVSLGVPGGAPGTTLTVTGNYVGVGGTLAMNTLLNGGGALANQFTDRLLVHGNADDTTVRVRPSGGGAVTSINAPSATTGISIIQVAGTSSVNAFTLAGGYVAGGPYQYRLNAYGPGSAYGAAAASQNLVGNAANYWDYRLQNVFVSPSGPVDPGQPLDPTNTRPALAPQVPAYITAPTALFSAGLQDIDELHRRLGEIRDAQAKGLPQTAEFFARGYGNTMTYQSNRSFADYGINASESYAAFQLGGSAVVTNDDLGMLRLGLAGSYGKLQFDPNAPDGFSEGNINVGKVSGIATFQSRMGWYLDGIVSGGWFNGTVGTAARGQAAALSGSMVGASLEGGYPIGLGWQKLLVEPQVQVSWQHLMFDGTTDVDSIRANLGTLDQGIVRAGGRVVRPFETDDGRFVTPYVKANLLQGFADNNNAINVGGVNFNTGQYGTAIQVGGGVTGMLMANLAVYGDVSYQHEVSTGGFRGWAFNGGVRYSF